METSVCPDGHWANVNVVASVINIIKICYRYKCKLIFPSTTRVYGSQENILDESCPIKDLKPQSPYAEVKLLEENYINKFALGREL